MPSNNSKECIFYFMQANPTRDFLITAYHLSILTAMYSEWKGLKDTEKSSFDKMAKNDEKRYSLVEKQDSLITYTEKAGLFLFPQGMELLESDVEKTISVWKYDHNSLCEKCGQGGEVLLCEGCNLSYHPTCLQPALVDIPDEAWLCPECRASAVGVGKTRW